MSDGMLLTLTKPFLKLKLAQLLDLHIMQTCDFLPQEPPLQSLIKKKK